LIWTIRGTDAVYRAGGDEFSVIVQPLPDPHALRYTAERILGAIAVPCDLAGHQVVSTVSIGASMYPQDTDDLTALISNADMAMYAAKKSGKNAFLAFDSEMFLLNKQRLELERDIRRAVENSEFVVFYQGKFSAKTNGLVGVEALLRWKLPDGTVISPGEFIPVAESTGLIVDLGRWVLLQACIHAQSWAEQGLGHIQVSVNVSARQLRDPAFLEDVISMLHATGLPPSLLELELTESVLMDDVEEAIVLMRAAQEQGIQIAIDDFGTGFSSLAYLQKFPLNRLKIDRSFISRLPGSGDAIVNAIIGLAHSFDLEVVAEGVETGRQLEWLRTAGCDIIQGFLLGRPVSEEDIRRLLAKGVG
jgi:EAL domain-containing protein (putative c-di-GMP-specific phosphodiesterase class I)